MKDFFTRLYDLIMSFFTGIRQFALKVWNMPADQFLELLLQALPYLGGFVFVLILFMLRKRIKKKLLYMNFGAKKKKGRSTKEEYLKLMETLVIIQNGLSDYVPLKEIKDTIQKGFNLVRNKGASINGHEKGDIFCDARDILRTLHYAFDGVPIGASRERVVQQYQEALGFVRNDLESLMNQIRDKIEAGNGAGGNRTPICAMRPRRDPITPRPLQFLKHDSTQNSLKHKTVNEKDGPMAGPKAS